MSNPLRWLEIQAEVDWIHFQLTQMLEKEKRMIPIERMIEQATGFDKEKEKIAEKLIRRAEKLKKEYYKITGKEHHD